MRLYGEIFQGLDLDETFVGARCLFFPHGGGYFQGVKGIGYLSCERVVLVLKRADVEVVGENLAVAKYCEGDLQLTGKIRSIGVVGGTEK